MTRIVFAHDHRFVSVPDGSVLSEGKLPYQVWQRYLSVFNEVEVIGRVRHLPADAQTSGLARSSGKNVRFTFVPSLSNPLSRLGNVHQAINRIREVVSRSDGVIARLPSETGLLAVQIAENLRKPWMVEVVGCPWDAAIHYNGWKTIPFAPLLWIRTKHAVKRSPIAIYVTREFLQRRYPTDGIAFSCSNVEVVPNTAQVLRQRKLRIANNTNVVKLGMIASLRPKYKGIKTALKALAYLNDISDKHHFELHILGDGPQDGWQILAKRLNISHQLYFHGTVPSGNAVWSWLDSITIYLQPSYAEGLPRALVEAMARACPALGSTAGGIPELLPQTWLHRPKDWKTLATQILRISSSPDLQYALAEQNAATSVLYSKEKLRSIRESAYSQFRDLLYIGYHRRVG